MAAGNELSTRPHLRWCRLSVLGLALVATLLIVWFLADRRPGSLAVRNLVCWLFLLAVHIGLVRVAPRVARQATNPGARRIWLVVAAGCFLFLVGDLVQLVAILRGPMTPEIVTGIPVQSLLVTLGIGVFVLGTLTAPMGFTAPRERLRFWMDAATVMAAGVAVGLYIAVGPARAIHSEADLASGLDNLLWTPGLIVVDLFVVTKLVLSRDPPMNRPAGVLAVTSAATVAAVQSYPWDLTFSSGHLDLLLAIAVLSNSLLLAATLVQHQAVPGADARRARRSFSLLPYAAIAAVYGVLVLTLFRHGLDVRAWVALGSAIVCTCLVVVRQVLAFVDNARLVRALNTEMHQRQELATELHYQAYHDALTGLANRSLFTERLETAITDGMRVVVMIVDLDDFKPVNDRLGHRIGDLLLVEVAARLSNCVREQDTVARLGGDEFGILLAGAGSVDTAAVADRVVAAVGLPMSLLGHDVTVSASVGAATGPALNADALLHSADAAMYTSKRTGKGSFTIARIDTD